MPMQMLSDECQAAFVLEGKVVESGAGLRPVLSCRFFDGKKLMDMAVFASLLFVKVGLKKDRLSFRKLSLSF